ncbi:16651_t:CDS:2 [Funneliformis geosporum]|uniref:valine--tRNA ligase n=1 Tax=Funneliformis geosporum TaxID=1117311 RepID=A0A9W4SD73_9GLOM|nr:16651_t:CDS:2 [Funneliformis geosporum]
MREFLRKQWEKLGLLIDYERASFTLNPIIQQQVRAAFVKLYQEGLIYRGKKLVNWDPQLKSVISDIEVEHKPSKSKLYYLKYPLRNSNNYLLVATSRPETIFADVAFIKIDFGSGVLKCTPGHDFTDYELGKKYQLPIISCCNEQGILNELASQWQGQAISSIREELVAKLVEKDICVKIEEYETNLAYSSKSGTVIEPLLSQQ